MRLPHLFDYSLELLVGFEEVLVDFVHISSQLVNLLIALPNQLSSNQQTLLPLLDPIQHLLDIPIDLLIHLLPLLHLLQLHLSWSVVSILIGDDAIILLPWLEQLLTHLGVGLVLVAAYQLAVEVC